MKKAILAISLLALMVTTSFAGTQAYISTNTMTPDELAILAQELKEEGVEEVIFKAGKKDVKSETEVTIDELVEMISEWKEEGITEVAFKEMSVDDEKTLVKTETVSIDELETLLKSVEGEGLDSVKFMDISEKAKAYIVGMKNKLSAIYIKNPENVRNFLAELKEKIPEEIKNNPEKVREFVGEMKEKLQAEIAEKSEEVVDTITLLKVTKNGETNLTVTKGPIGAEKAMKFLKNTKEKFMDSRMKMSPRNIQFNRPGMYQQRPMQINRMTTPFNQKNPFTGKVRTK